MFFLEKARMQLKLFLSYLILIALPLCALGYFSYSSASKALVSQFSQSLSSIVDKSVKQMDAFLDVCMRDVEELSSKPTTQIAFYLNDYMRSRLSDVIHEYRDYINKRPYLSRIRLVSLEGKQVLTTLDNSEDINKDESKAGWFRGALADREKVYISDMYLDQTMTAATLTMSKVLTSKEGKEVGVIALDIKGKAITSFIDEIKAGETGYGYLVNKDGIAIAHPKKDNILHLNILKSSDKRLAEVGRHMIKMKRGHGEYEFEGVLKHIFYSPYQRFNWSAAITIPDDELFREASKLKGVIVAVGIISIIVAIIFSFFISVSITNPIEKLKEGMKNIGAKNLTKAIRVNSRDEIGELALSYNKVIETLREVILHIRNAGFEINQFASKINSNATKQASDAQAQATTVEQASSTAEELASTSSHIAESSEGVAKIAERTFLSMQEVNQKIIQTDKHIANLERKLEHIGGIIELIDNVVEQTNLLALNASIEAARAGEAGRGFSIVAGEVKKLASKSSSSTNEIRVIINEIQEETKLAVSNMSVSVKQVAQVLELVQETSNAAQEISRIIQEQRVASNETVGCILNISNVTQQFLSSTQQFMDSASKLSNLSEELKKSVGEFVLETS
ncbi:MAG: methyl-accepting chemotaxis protein [Candidatus Omnitrophota bacterium]|jgi:methyl-accepting chemotaxis protein